MSVPLGQKFPTTVSSSVEQPLGSAVASSHAGGGLLGGAISGGGLLVLTLSTLGGSSNDGLLLLEGGGHDGAGDTCKIDEIGLTTENENGTKGWHD